MLSKPLTSSSEFETWVRPVSAAESPSEPERWVVRMTVDITDQSGQPVTCASTRTTLTGSVNSAIGTAPGALLTIALGLLEDAGSQLLIDWKAITDTTSGKSTS